MIYLLSRLIINVFLLHVIYTERIAHVLEREKEY